MQGQKGPKWSVKLANLHKLRTKVKADITRLYEIEVKERVEGQASKKAQEERYGCMDRQQQVAVHIMLLHSQSRYVPRSCQ